MLGFAHPEHRQSAAALHRAALADAAIAWDALARAIASPPALGDADQALQFEQDAVHAQEFVVPLIAARAAVALGALAAPSPAREALIRAARLASEQRRGPQYGLPAVDGKPDFAAVMERVQRVIAAVEPHDSVQRYEALGVECLHGEARLVDPWTVEVGEQRLTARNIVLATGARPFVPPIPGLAEAGYLTSDTVWQLRTLPARLVVLGGGPIGCELAQAFARLGAQARAAATQLALDKLEPLLETLLKIHELAQPRFSTVL